MPSQTVVIYGAGALARLMHHYLAQAGSQVVAFAVDREWRQEKECDGMPIIPMEDLPKFHPPHSCQLLLAVGYRRMRNRQTMFHRAKCCGYQLANYIDPTAIVAPNVKLGENNILMPQVQLEPFVTIGDNNLFWSGTIVAHHGQVGNHNFFAPRCTLSGNVTIGDRCFFGTGSTLIDGLQIADETHLVAGSVCLEDTEMATRYQGNPAQACRQHTEDGIVIRR